MIIDGKKIAEEIIGKLKKIPTPKKYCAGIIVGENLASQNFIQQKEKVAKKLGVDFRIYQFTEQTMQDTLRKEIFKIAHHKTCGGVIVQLPLPPHINKHYICNAIPREKDVDVLGERALGAFYTGRNLIPPPAVGVIQKIIQNSYLADRQIKLEIKNFRIAIVGLGFLVGKSIATWCIGKCKEICLFDEGSDITHGLKNADIVISGVGKLNLITPEMLKENALMIDFGCSFVNGKICGDFNAEELKTPALPTGMQAKFEISYTPTPGGTGPILVAQLFENFYTLNKDKKTL